MLTILSEAHFSKSSIEFIENYIRENKPTVLLHELAYDGVLSATQVKKELTNCGLGNYCDPKTNMDIFKLCSELNIGLIGIDLAIDELDQISKSKSLGEQFIQREEKMLDVLKKHQSGNVIAVIGDAHVREKRTTWVEKSPITEAIKNGTLKAKLIRVSEKDRELK